MTKGSHQSQEAKIKMSIAHKRLPSPFKGKHHSEGTKTKISNTKKGCSIWNKGIPCSDEKKRKLSLSNMGKKLSLETRKRMSMVKKGIPLSLEHRNRLKGHFAWNTGQHLSDEHKKKLSESSTGEKNHNWKGGTSFAPYSLDWTQTLKRSIRERDRYTCQLCGGLQSDRAFDVHHIDGIKTNADPNNLITLCRNCHMKITNKK